MLYLDSFYSIIAVSNYWRFWGTVHLSFSVGSPSLLYKVCGFGYFKMKNIIEIIVDDFRKGIIELDSLQRCIKSAMIIYSCVVYETKSFTVMIGGVGCYFQRRILKFQFLSFLYLVDYVHSRNFVKCTRTHVGSVGGNTKGNIKTVI